MMTGTKVIPTVNTVGIFVLSGKKGLHQVVYTTQ